MSISLIYSLFSNSNMDTYPLPKLRNFGKSLDERGMFLTTLERIGTRNGKNAIFLRAAI